MNRYISKGEEIGEEAIIFHTELSESKTTALSLDTIFIYIFMISLNQNPGELLEPVLLIVVQFVTEL